MGFHLKKIISVSMENSKILNHFNPSDTEYKDVKWLGYRTDSLNEGYVYVGLSSMLPDNFDAYGAAFVVVNDCGMDFSNCPVELVEIDNSVDVMEMFLSIKRVCKKPITEELLYALLAEKSIPEILDFCSSFFQNPLIMFGSCSNVLCYSPKYDTHEYIPVNGIDRSQFSSTAIEYFLNSNIPILFEDGCCFRGKIRIARRLSIGSKNIGAIALFEVNRKLRDEDFIYLQIISKAILNKLAVQEHQRDFYSLQFEQVMIDLLKGNKISFINNKWFSHINVHKHQNFIVSALNCSRLTSRQCDELERFIIGKLYFCTTVKYDNDIVVLANPRNEEEHQMLKDILYSAIDQFSVEVGCSNTFKDIRDLRIYYKQAVDSREHGCSFGSKRDIHEFKKLKNYILLKEIASKVDLSYYINNDCEALIAHDSLKNTEYWKTLLTFLRCGKSRQKTCKLLNIHKNTLAYRLDRITQLLGSLDDGDLLFDVYLSAMIKEVLAMNEHKG